MEALNPEPSILEALTTAARRTSQAPKKASVAPASAVDDEIDAFADDAFAALVLPNKPPSNRQERVAAAEPAGNLDDASLAGIEDFEFREAAFDAQADEEAVADFANGLGPAGVDMEFVQASDEAQEMTNASGRAEGYDTFRPPPASEDVADLPPSSFSGEEEVTGGLDQDFSLEAATQAPMQLGEEDHSEEDGAFEVQSLPDLEEENQALRQQVAQMHSEMGEAQAFLQSLQESYATLKSDVEALRSVDVAAQTQRLQADANVLKAALQASRDQERQLREQLDVAMQHGRELRSQLEEALQQSQNLELQSDDVSKLHEQLQHLQRKLDAERKVVERAKRAISIGVGLLDDQGRGESES